MTSRRRDLAAPIRILALLPLAAACSSAPHVDKGSPAAPAPRTDPEPKISAARDKLKLTKLQMEIGGKKAEEGRSRKERELELARAELAQFDEVDAPTRLAKSRLDLARRRDAVFEQEEELAQLEMMYEKEQLADKTREIVLERGKRRVERAKEELAIGEREAAGLESRTLPRERTKLALEAESKARELEGLARETEAATLEKSMAVKAAEAELHAAEAGAGPKP